MNKWLKGTPKSKQYLQFIPHHSQSSILDDDIPSKPQALKPKSNTNTNDLTWQP